LKPNLLKTAAAHISVLTADTQLACGSQNQQQPALLKLQNLSFQKEDHPYLGTEIRLKIQVIFMATAGHPQVGSPPLGCRTYVAKAIRATPSRITSCLKPNLLKTAEAHSPVVTAWQYRWATCDRQVASPLLGNPACLGKLKKKTTASSSAECAKPQVSISRSTPTRKLKFAEKFEPDSWQVLGTPT